MPDTLHQSSPALMHILMLVVVLLILLLRRV